jgi:two-component system response regulator AtoC
MPEKDGLYFLKELRERESEIKVIVLTAYADVKSAIDSARLGASDFISKPYDLDELLTTMRRVLQKEEYEN